jgi:hypothetical protein
MTSVVGCLGVVVRRGEMACSATEQIRIRAQT